MKKAILMALLALSVSSLVNVEAGRYRHGRRGYRRHRRSNFGRNVGLGLLSTLPLAIGAAAASSSSSRRDDDYLRRVVNDQNDQIQQLLQQNEQLQFQLQQLSE